MPMPSNVDYAKALIKAGIARDLVLKITAISEYQYTVLLRELSAA